MPPTHWLLRLWSVRLPKFRFLIQTSLSGSISKTLHTQFAPTMNIEFEDKIKEVAPNLVVMCVEANIINVYTEDTLWQEISECAAKIQASTAMEQVRHRPAIDATRCVYKALGKDPNRYRPSAEALCRRAVKGLTLYRSLTAIDLINLVSLISGHSIGGFDVDKIEGETLRLGVGRADEPYEAIGRGMLNIEGLPVYRDTIGGIGTPTSDNERTKLSEKTRRLLMTVNIYGDSELSVDDIESLIRRLLINYAMAEDIKISYARP